MMKQIRKVKPVAVLFLACFLLGCMLLALHQLNLGQQAEGKAQLERSIRRAAVACYSAKGFYPPSLEYLQDHYGVQVDTRRYVVYYSAFADNLMPDIVVLEQNHA